MRFRRGGHFIKRKNRGRDPAAQKRRAATTPTPLTTTKSLNNQDTRNMKEYQDYKKRMKEIYFLDTAIAQLQWDQEVMLPSSGTDFRSRQIAHLSALSHDKFTSDAMGELLKKASIADLSAEQRINIEKSIYDYKTARQLSSSFVEKRSKYVSLAYEAWIQSRKNNKIKTYLDALKPLIEIKREEAELRGYSNHPYDAMLNIYDPGLTVTYLNPLFKDLDNQLKEIIENCLQIQEDHRSILERKVPKDAQWKFSLNVLQLMQFDLNKGRQDLSEHPFTISLAPKDIRITTRHSAENISSTIWGSIHEGGHGLYEQGLNKEKYEGLPLGQAASLSIHESQARLWETQIGKSVPFWTFLYPKLQEAYGEYAPTEDVNTFLKSMHYVAPNLIRTEADDLHYHRHIIIRYELEKELFSGNLNVLDLEEAWNAKYQSKMGLTPKTPNQGLLQDVHWAHGGFGYFPTYTLGSIYAASLFEKMNTDIPHLEKDISSMNFSRVLEWLQNNIFQYGRKYESQELMHKILGHPPTSSKLTEIYQNKMDSLYGQN